MNVFSKEICVKSLKVSLQESSQSNGVFKVLFSLCHAHTAQERLVGLGTRMRLYPIKDHLFIQCGHKC